MTRILVVDDDPSSAALVRVHLEQTGVEVQVASGGHEALRLEALDPPDLVILDVIMPELDGFATLRELKARAHARYEYLPVVLVTALSDRESRAQGWKLGADEFVTKPIDGTELRLRVENLLALRQERAKLQLQNTRLLELQRFKDEMSTLIIHDLKNPAAAVLNNLDFVLDNNDAETAVRHEALADARDASRRFLRLLANLLDISKAEDSRLEVHRTPIALSTMISPIVNLRHHMSSDRGIHMHSEIDTRIIAPIDADLVARSIENILDNALRYTPRGGTIALSATMSEGQLQIRIANSGPSIPAPMRSQLFEKYANHIHHAASGLGLYFCRIAAEAHGGRIAIEEELEFPTVFVLTLPTHQRNQLQ